MTESVAAQTPVTEHVGNGVTTSFAYTFTILDSADMVVELGGVVQGSGFTVSGVGVLAGGAVLFTSAPASGVSVLLRRSTDLSRSTAYTYAGDLREAVVDADFNRLWHAMQERAEVEGRALLAPVGETISALPPASQRADTQLLFDSAGEPYCGAPVSGSAADVMLQYASTAPGKGASLSGVEDAADNYNGTQVEAVLAEIAARIGQLAIMVTEPRFGAVADSNGTAGHGTDNTAAFTAAAAYAVTNRCTLVIPSSNGLMYRHTGPLPVLVEPLSGGIGRGCIIAGTGPGSVIFNDSTGDSFVLDSTSGAADMGTQIKLHNLRFHSNTGTRPTSFIRNKKGINTSVTDMHFMSVFIAAGGGCVINEVAYGLRYERNIHRGVVGTGLVLHQQVVEANGYSFIVSIDACDFSFCTTGIYAYGANCLSIRNTPVQQCTDGIVIDPVANGVSAFNITLENVWMENNAGWDINLNSDVSHWCEASIRRCQFGRGASNTRINLGSKSRIIVEGIATGPGSVEVFGSASASFTGFNTTPKFIQNGAFFWNEVDAAGGISTRYMGNDASNNIIAKLGAFVSAVSSVSVPTATATTLFALPSSTNAVYMLTTTAGASGPAAWTVVAIVACSASLATLTVLKTSSNLTLSLSGLNVQGTHAAGVSVSVSTTVTRIQ